MSKVSGTNNINKILEQFKQGDIGIDEASDELKHVLFTDLGHSVVDHQRLYRQGAAEVIYAEGKTAENVADIFSALAKRDNNVLATRASAEKFAAVQATVPAAEYRSDIKMIYLKNNAAPRAKTQGPVAVVSAGTSDNVVAEEAAFTAEFFDNEVLRINDVGVAGINRLLARLEEIRQASVVIVVAGMEGALPSVVAGLVERPVIAVPTSVGYGAAFDGLSALLTMLNSCASGVSVVNIDNGFGAGYMATVINSPFDG